MTQTKMVKPESSPGLHQAGYFAISGVILILGFSTGNACAAGRAAAADETSLPSVSADPHDISGLWFSAGFRNPVNQTVRPIGGGDPPFTPAGAALYKKRRDADKAGTPLFPLAEGCVTSSFLGFRPTAPDLIIQTPGQITFVQEVYHDFNIIHMDKPHPRTIRPTFAGNSVGHWEGDTLVVDTIGYQDGIWLDYTGTPAGSQLHVVEHIRKVNTGKTILEDIMTITDPENYTKPWNVRRAYLWRPAERIVEEVCEENLGQGDPEKSEPDGKTFINP
jgi:hypothetical protein